MRGLTRAAAGAGRIAVDGRIRPLVATDTGRAEEAEGQPVPAAERAPTGRAIHHVFFNAPPWGLMPCRAAAWRLLRSFQAQPRPDAAAGQATVGKQVPTRLKHQRGASGPSASLVPIPVTATPRGDVDLEFTGEVWFWKGPAPWYFVTVPDDECVELEAASRLVTYGWGMIPVAAQIGLTRWT